MKKAILLIYFGTANKDAVENCIFFFQNEIREKFNNEYLVLNAFSSKTLISILKKKEDISIFHTVEALEYLKSERYQDIIVQPMQVMAGNEYTEIENIASSYKNDFKSIKIGKALLGYEKEELCKACDKVINSISGEIDKNKTTIIVGHGSKSLADEVYFVLEDRFEKLGYKNIIVGTLEGKKSLESILIELKSKKIKAVNIMPFLLIPGNHMKKDIELSDKSWRARISEENIEVEIKMKSLLEYEKIKEIYREQLNIN